MYNIEEMKSAIMATRAYDATSFDPEGRLGREASGFVRNVHAMEEYAAEKGVDPEWVINKYFKLEMASLAAEARCVSWAVVGPAGLNVDRVRKAADRSMDRMGDLVHFMEDWKEYIDRAARRATRVDVSQQDKAAAWDARADELEAKQEKMKKANALIRKKDMEGLEALMGKDAAAQLMKPDYCGRVGFPSYLLSNNLANIKRLRAQAAQTRRLSERSADEYSFTFDGGRVEYDAEEIRYNIIYEEKPDEETRKSLKSWGFKWSPRRTAWTRGAKTISLDSVRRLVGVTC